MTKQNTSWHHGAVVYQIYSRSFYDSANSGVGNISGIIEKLDYLNGTPDSLGVNAIWISPIFKSPMADFGYDVADYEDVDPLFGSLDDVKLLVHEAHRRNIKVMLDFVPNHSSDEHPWFIESKSSLDNPKRDWYTWRDPGPDGGPPNNWLSVFNGSAWEYSEETGQYYLHSFLAKQPDLNWDNPEVREAMKSAMRFWLDIGVDGFRVDAVEWMSKDSELRDDEINHEAPPETDRSKYYTLKHTFSRNGPNLHARLSEMTEVLREYPDRFMVTEAHPEVDDKVQGYLEYYKNVNPQLSAPFNFEGIHLPWNATTFRDFIDNYQSAMEEDYVPIYNLGNHDESRLASRIGRPAARTAAMMLLSLPGMSFVYYGDEIGMVDVEISDSQRRDPYVEPGRGRDPERTPMQWSDKTHAGFSSSEPWLPVAPDYQAVNVEAQSTNPTSSLSLYKSLIRLRNESVTLKYGNYASLDVGEHILGYERVHDGQRIIVLLNFLDSEQSVDLPAARGRVLLSTLLDTDSLNIEGNISLRPHEGLIIEAQDD